MKRHLLLAVGLIGLVETIAPKTVVRAFTKVAYRNAADAEPRDWFHVVARAEGAALVFVALVGLYRTSKREPEADADRHDDASSD